jgi:hypothetical protein
MNHETRIKYVRLFAAKLGWARVGVFALPLYCLAVHLQGCSASQDDAGASSDNIVSHGPYDYGYGGGYGNCEGYGYGYGSCP